MNTNVNITMGITLPRQSEVDDFLKEWFPSHKDESFYLTFLTEQVIRYFEVSPHDSNLKYDHSHGQTSAETTCIEQLTNWGCVHLLLADIIKRTGPNEYQHITGPRPVYNIGKVSRKLVGQAVVSVNILKELKWEPERIMLELHSWPDDVIEAAIIKVFGSV